MSLQLEIIMPRRKKDITEAQGKANMLPLALRFTEPQMRGLNKLYARTQLPVTEHVRRAVDAYLKDERAA